MFYVYEYYIISTNTVFYVGKGCGKRYKNITNRNSDFLKIIKSHPDDYNVRIVKYFKEEDEAFLYESELIKHYKENGTFLCNKNYGGLGGVAGVWTEEKRKYHSIHNPMKDENQRERMRKNNPAFKRETWANKARRNNSILSFYGKEYYTFQELANAWGVSCVTVSASWRNKLNKIQEWIPFPENKDGPFTEVEKNMIKTKLMKDSLDKKPKHTTGQPITLFEVNYFSIREASNILGIGEDTVKRWKEKEKEILSLLPSLKGARREILPEEKKKICYSIKHKAKSNPLKKAIVIDDTVYSCAGEAAELLHIPANTIRSRCKNPNFSNYYFFDNQQPSQ